jgi:hypothetical protein
METMRSRALAVLSALAIMLLFQIPITRVDADNDAARDNGRTLHLRVYFEQFATSDQSFGFGAQLTFKGTFARFDRPNERIGTFAMHSVVTAPFAAETLLYGVLNFSDGQISFTALSPTQPPRIPGPITGGTGAYKNAGGQIEHVSHPGGVEELILTFHGK